MAGLSRFGTDGVRGVANRDLTPEVALALGRAAARCLSGRALVVGRDTRWSGPMLNAAFSAGCAAEGMDVIDVGVLPTPGVAYLCQRDALLGAVVSASHNPFGDNGIKLITPSGGKLDEPKEAEIEAEMDRLLEQRGLVGPRGRGIGRITEDRALRAHYLEHLTASVEGTDLSGLRIVADCANGAAGEVVGELLDSLAVSHVLIASEPDGTNINANCGSLHPEALAAAVVASGADLGLAFDGDADRVIAVDAEGGVVGGDQLLALFALDLDQRGELANRAIAVTVMSNLGLRRALKAAGITCIETPVGDRQIVAAIEQHDLVLGGEQSGHIVFRRIATTGDGILTGLMLAALIVRAGAPLRALASGAMQPLPQLLGRVEVAEPHRLGTAAAIWEAVTSAERRLGSSGRVLVRASGTEPVVRVMVETDSEPLAEELLAQLCAVVSDELGAVSEIGR
jgi:phosphoglucosamine mutase